jgi:hypothetical protein
MPKQRKTYWERGQRLKQFYLIHWKGTEESFAAELHIDVKRLKKYFSGEMDPLIHAKELISLGVDLHHLATGSYVIGIEEPALRHLADESDCKTYMDLYELLYHYRIHAKRLECPDEAITKIMSWGTISLNEFTVTALSIAGYACIVIGHVHA